jgi:hypothetical protein
MDLGVWYSGDNCELQAGIRVKASRLGWHKGTEADPFVKRKRI